MHQYYTKLLFELLLQLACKDVYRAKWTDRIHNEWISNLLKNRPDISKEALDITKNKIFNISNFSKTNLKILNPLQAFYSTLEKKAFPLVKSYMLHPLPASINKSPSSS